VLDDPTLARLLAHVGLTERPAADVAGLRAAHRAFVSHVAYAGLTPQLGEYAPLDDQALVARLLAGGRGGYCFEMNTMLQALLEGLGFAVERRQAIVEARAAIATARVDHLVLVVDADGERFVADAGWGEGPMEPIPLRAGTHTAGPFSWTLEREGDGWWIDQHAWGGTPGFWFSDAPASLEDFAPHHLRMATAPESNFVKTLVVEQPFDDHIVTLRARTLFRRGPGRDDRLVLPDAAALATTLRDVFGIDPGALGPERLARLWRQACAQHDAFVTRPSAA
jgi:N-hydroxyarylamine O-acetyltransferase